MANILKVKRSSVQGKVPLTTDLDLGELAVNTYDGKLFLKKNVGGTETIVDVTVGADAATILTLLKTVDGSGSGLDADLVEGMHAVSTNTVNSVVARDASGNFSAGTITAALSGNASTTTKLATARTISITGDVTGSVSFDGSADASITATIAANSVALGTDTTGNYVASVATTAPLSGGAVGSEGGALTLSLASGYGDTQNPYASKTANTVLAAPNGSAGVPSFRALVAQDIPALDASKITSGVLDAARLPSYVDDVLEYTNLASFPATGETGKIYVDLATNKTYRWSGTVYVYITSGAVDSVAGKTGVVTLTNSDVGLGNVENKSSATIRGELTSTNVTTALGYTPYNSTNPNGYTTNTGTVTSVTGGSYLTGGTITTTGTLAVDATSANTASKVVARDASGNFSAGTITASLSGTVTTPNGSSGIFVGDDAIIADRNVANTVFISGSQNSDRGYINFSTSTTNSLGAIAGGALTWNGNTIWHAGNDGASSGLDADTLDGTHLSGLVLRDEVKSFGSIAIQAVAGSSQSCTTAQFITYLETLGFFDYSYSFAKCTWDYAGNNDISDTGFGANFELAGCVIETWTDNSDDTVRGNITVRITAPTTGGTGGGKILVYNDQGVGYSPGWRQLWTSTTDGSGSGLDADTLDGNHASAFYLASNPSGYTTNTGTVTSIATGTGLSGGTITTSGTISLANTAVTAGSYTAANITVDAQGRITAASNGSSGSSVTISDDTTTNATRYLVFEDVTSGTSTSMQVSSTKLTFNPSTGNLTAAGNITAYSDERLKTNIETIKNAVEKVKCIRGVVFDRIDTTNRQTGVIAQEVRKVLPEAVLEDTEGTLSVAYGNLVGLLIEAIKEQDQKISRLEKLLENK